MMDDEKLADLVEDHSAHLVDALNAAVEGCPKAAEVSLVLAEYTLGLIEDEVSRG
jgi:hypothetical protein